MQLRTIAGALALVASLVVGAWGTHASAAASVKWALVNLTETTSIAGAFVSGPVLFVHDDARMARGEPCTGVYRFIPGKGVGEQIVAFHCAPHWKKAPTEFTSSVARSPYGPRVLTDYQFAGDDEVHGVPVSNR